jgi:hypothetical protein
MGKEAAVSPLSDGFMLGVSNDYVSGFPISKMLMLPLRFGFHLIRASYEELA